MTTRVTGRCLAWAAFLMASFWLVRAASSLAPATLADRKFSIIDTNGFSIMSFLQSHRYEWTRIGGAVETGYFFASLSNNTWSVAATKEDGTLTTLISLRFDASTNGQATLTVAGEPRKVLTFQEGDITPPKFAPASLITLNIQNTASITGPSSYTIHFTGATNGAFNIDLPGYGSGTFVYTPSTNTARLVLTYTGDLAGDTDDLNLEFKGPAGSDPTHLQSGVQRVSGAVYPVEGTFTYTGVPQ